MKCRACGAMLREDAKFCPSCGARVQDTEKICPHCGAATKPGARFCEFCGGALSAEPVPEKTSAKPTPVPPPVSARKRPEEICRRCGQPLRPGAGFCGSCGTAKGQTRRKPSRAGWICSITALILSLVLLAGSILVPIPAGKPGNTPADATDIREAVQSAAGVSAPMTMENPHAAFDSGVEVAVDGMLTVSEGQVTVRDLGLQTVGDRQAMVYDLSLTDAGEAEDHGSEFFGAAEVTLPYDPAWGANVSVRYLNPETDEWEFCWSDNDGKGNAVLLTDHFSTFGVFCEAVMDGETVVPGDPNGPVLNLCDPDEATAYIRLDYAALATQVRKGLKGIKEPEAFDLSGLVKAEDLADHAQHGMDGLETGTLAEQMGNAGFRTYLWGAEMFGENGSSLFDAFLAYAPKGKKLAESMGTKLCNSVSVIGGSFTILRVTADAAWTGNWKDTFLKNSLDLTGAAVQIGGSFASRGKNIADAASLALFIADVALNDIPDFIALGTAESAAERAYWDVTSGSLTRYSPETGSFYTDSSRQYFDSDVRFRKVWKDVLDAYIDMRLQGGDEKLPSPREYLEPKVDAYVNWFWNYVKENPEQWKTYLASSNFSWKDDYEDPSADDIKRFRERFKHDVYCDLKPMAEAMLKKLNAAVLRKEVGVIEREVERLNAWTQVRLIDSGFDGPFVYSPFGSSESFYLVNGTGKSAFSNRPIKLNQWHFRTYGGGTWEKTPVILFSQLGYELAGCPQYVMATDAKDVGRIPVPADFHTEVYENFDSKKDVVVGPMQMVVSEDQPSGSYTAKHIDLVRDNKFRPACDYTGEYIVEYINDLDSDKNQTGYMRMTYLEPMYPDSDPEGQKSAYYDIESDIPYLSSGTSNWLIVQTDRTVLLKDGYEFVFTMDGNTMRADLYNPFKDAVTFHITAVRVG